MLFPRVLAKQKEGFRGGSAEIVNRLLDLKANVDYRNVTQDVLVPRLLYYSRLPCLSVYYRVFWQVLVYCNSR